jgi:ABC-type lipoprotein release transport system permease subunit
VGYGDYFPRTTPGRIVAFLCSIVGIVIVSLVVVSIMNQFTMSALEQKAFTVINRIQIKNSMKMNASKIISKLLKLNTKVRKNSQVNIKEVYGLNNTIKDFQD